MSEVPARVTGFALILLLVATPAFASDWVALFDGLSFSGWTKQDGSPVTPGAWEVVDGMLHLNTSQGRGGNLITDRDYGDFELVFEWKVLEGGNNGIKYRVQDFGGRLLGCEYQIIDDARSDLRPNQKTAALYDLFEPPLHNVLHPPGQFNRGRIVVHGNHIEHWLNGHLMVCVNVDSPEWEQRVASSKFNDAEGFGQNRLGRIMLTDHHDEVWFRNVFIRELSCTQYVGRRTLAPRRLCNHRRPLLGRVLRRWSRR